MSIIQKKSWGAVFLVAIGLGALALAGCGGAGGGANGGAYNYGNSSATSTTSGGGSVAVNLNCASGATVCTKQVMQSGQATTVLANTSGMTLYYFTLDTTTTSNCSGSCTQIWPALTASGANVTGSGLTGTLATLTDANGQQVTYNGHPLYTYVGDRAQSDAAGDGMSGQGGQWYAAKPTLASLGASSSATATPNSGGSGYGAGY